MPEAFLHYIWQFQYFDKTNLLTTSGEGVEVIKPGILNFDAGPDFSNAKVMIGSLSWVGTVEIHVKASDWNVHHHDQDEAYENVVLHVVWEADQIIERPDGTLLPTVELKSRVEPALINSFRRLVNNPATVPCRNSILSVDPIIKRSMLDKSLMQRLERKANEVIELYHQTGKHWGEVTYQLLARNFGFKVNTDPFHQLSKSLPYKLLLKHGNNALQQEALLFGQAGFLLKEIRDPYIIQAKREYDLLATKYQLEDGRMNWSQWRFLRLRPANFPTVRLAQLAALLHQRRNLFSELLEISGIDRFRKFFAVKQTDYWLTHYRPGKSARQIIPGLGQSSIDNLLMNTVVPLLVAYGKKADLQIMIDRAVDLLQELPPEQNRIISLWNKLGMGAHNAFDSQALIELYNEYCAKRSCLNCVIGASLLKPSPIRD